MNDMYYGRDWIRNTGNVSTNCNSSHASHIVSSSNLTFHANTLICQYWIIYYLQLKFFIQPPPKLTNDRGPVLDNTSNYFNIKGCTFFSVTL